MKIFKPLLLISILVSYSYLAFISGYKSGYQSSKSSVPTEVWDATHDSTNLYYVLCLRDTNKYSIILGDSVKVELPIDSLKLTNSKLNVWVKSK